MLETSTIEYVSDIKVTSVEIVRIRIMIVGVVKNKYGSSTEAGD